MVVQISPEGSCVSCQPQLLRPSRTAATASVNVRPPCRSPTIDPGGSARASLTLITLVIIPAVSTPKAKAGLFSPDVAGPKICMVILSILNVQDESPSMFEMYAWIRRQKECTDNA